MAQRPLVIVNQIDAEFGECLRGLPQAPQVIDHLDADFPWEIPPAAQALVTRALPAWRRAPDTQPWALPDLGWVQTYSAGIEIYPKWLLAGREVSCGRGLTSPQIAEYVLAAILRVEKNLEGLRVRSPSDWKDMAVGAIEGKCLGLIGFGSIGQEIAHRARAFGMKIMALRRGDWPDPPDRLRPARDLAEIMAVSDHLVLATPLTPDTAGMIGADALSLAKPGQHLINISRGGVLDQEALIAALDSGRLAQATLDVTTPEPLPEGHPLWSHPKVLLTPHVSYKGGVERQRFLSKVAHNLNAYLEGRPLLDAVDLERGY